jgi:hypothetical protein
VFGLLVLTMRGRWSPKGAKRDFEDHERRVERSWRSSARRRPGLRSRTFPSQYECAEKSGDQ